MAASGRSSKSLSSSSSKRLSYPDGSLGRIRELNTRLVHRYGPQPWSADEEPVLDSLIRTILSQATSDRNSDRAFAELKAVFPDWDQARMGKASRIEEAIRAGGLAKQKSLRIKTILDRVHAQHGTTSLEFLRDFPTPQIKAFLGGLPGVGPKTIACVLLFNLRRPDFPVDTHVHRISRRLRLVPDHFDARQTYQTLNESVPDELKYEFHVLLITHGRQVCHARNPACVGCPLDLFCPSSSNRGERKG